MILKQIADKDYLLEQAKFLKKKGFKPGFDGMSAENALMWIEINGAVWAKDIARGRYAPMPASGFRIAKLHGGFRQLAKLTALDSVVQYAIIHAITEQAEVRFSDFSFAYRPGRGVGQVLAQYCTFGNQYSYAARLDPAACFDNIDHSILQAALNEFFSEPKLTELIMKFATVPVVVDGQLAHNDSGKGILQGAPLSPLLCNIYFHQLDRFLERLFGDEDERQIYGQILEKVGKSIEIRIGYFTAPCGDVDDSRSCIAIGKPVFFVSGFPQKAVYLAKPTILVSVGEAELKIICAEKLTAVGTGVCVRCQDQLQMNSSFCRGENCFSAKNANSRTAARLLYRPKSKKYCLYLH